MTSSTRGRNASWPAATSATVDTEHLCIRLADGREIKVPINWFGWLARASDAQRRDVQVIEGGAGLWWEQLEESLSVPGLLGLPEFPPDNTP